MNRKLETEEIQRVLDGLEDGILIVEGKKDMEALRSLGLENIIPVNSRPIEKVAQDAVSLMEKHKKREVIVLTDFDRSGRRLASRLRQVLQSRKIHANSRIRSDVMNLGITHIEEMASMPGLPFLAGGISRESSVSGIPKLMERDYYGQTGTDFYKIRGKSLHKGKRDNRKARRDRGDIRAD
ncbi:MAG TPA: toprim domain-containing protein [archaeon]|nr:toprim domain-containing protein [archaeon]